MLPQLTKNLIEDWQTFFPKRKRPSKIDYLGILGSHEGGKISFLAFADKEKKPIFLVKILRTSNNPKRFFNERDGLTYLNSLNSFFGDSVPKVILCRMINNTWCLVESILEGNGMEVNLTKNGLPDLKEAKVNFNLAEDWLLKFNFETKNEAFISADFIRNYILNPIKKFQEIFVLNDSEKEYLKKILDGIASHKGETINLFFRHGDFCWQNILVSDSKIKLIDWEFSQKDSLPLYDIFFFLVTYYFQMAGEGRVIDRVACFQRTFFESNDYSNLVKQFITDYCEKLKINKTLIKSFFTSLLLERAVFEYQNLVELSEKGFIPFLEGPEKQDRTYLERMKNQLWINFFRFMVKNEFRFIL